MAAVPCRRARPLLLLAAASSWAARALHAPAAMGGTSIPLRLCNAYPFKLGLDVFHTPGGAAGNVTNLAPVERTDGVLLTRSGPLGYKRCRDLQLPPDDPPLVPGSLLSFRFSGGLEVGTFGVNGVPAGGTLLQIAVHRHDAFSAVAGFTSHVFAAGGGGDPEVAIVDAYRGKEKSFLELRNTKRRSVRERLRYGTAVTLPAGSYDCVLREEGPLAAGQAGEGPARESLGLRLAPGGKYTLLRIGVEALEGPSYPEGLVFWPSDVLRGATGGSWQFLPGSGSGAGAPAARLLAAAGAAATAWRGAWRAL